MSLINQVLQDLEKRHASEPELKSLPPHVRAVSARSERTPWTALLMAVAVLAIIAVGALLYFGIIPRPTVGVPAPAVPAQVAETPAAAPAPELSAQVFAPASRLSDELSVVPEARQRRESAPRPATRATPPSPQPAAATIPPEFRAAIEAPPAPAPKAVETNVVEARAAEVAPAPAAPRPPRPAEPVAAAPVQPAHPAAAAPATTEPRGSIDKQVREMTAAQRAEVAFRKGVAQLQEARVAAAETSFRDALREDPAHVGARQALLGLLLDAKRTDEAEQLLKQALDMNPRQPRHAMVLARLKVERGDITGAVNTLVATLPYVQSDAEYYAFLAALLQREGRHRETVDYYRAALQIAPGNGIWLMGLGISLRTTGQFGEARDVFQRALDTKQLNTELRAYTEKQLRELGTAPKK